MILRLLFFLLFLPQVLFAQQLSVIPYVGINSSVVSGNPYAASLQKPEIEVDYYGQAGLLAEYGFNARWMVVAGVGYVGRGFTATYESPAATNSTYKYTYEHNLHYLEAPLMGKVAFDVWGRKFTLQAGPYAAWLLGHNVDQEIAGSLDPPLPDAAFDEFDAGFTTGLGWVRKFGSGDLVLEFRYTHGLSELVEHHPNSARVKNRTLALTAGYSFGFNKDKP